MGSIPPKKLAEITRDVADEVAFESGRPWRVEDLRAEALEAYRTAERRAASAGLSGEQTSKLVRVYEQVLKAGREIDALPPGQTTRTPGQIATALAAFSTEQWRSLAETFHLEEADCVISFIDRHDNRHRLVQALGPEKWRAIVGALARHATDL